MAHPTYFHEFSCLHFNPFCGIYHDDYAVDRGQCAKSIFGKVLMAGCVEDIDFEIVVFEPHY